MLFNKTIRTAILCAVMAACVSGLVFGGGNQAGKTQSGSGGPVTVTYLMPGDAPLRYDEVIAEVNKKLAADKNIQIAITYIPWDVWQQKVNLMLTTGDEFDLFHIMQDQVLMSSYQGMGGLSDITSLIDQHGTNIKKVVSPGNIDALRINGKIYGIPAQWMELASEGVVTIRKDLLTRYNLSLPKTADDLLTIAETVATRWNGSGKVYIPMSGPGAANPFDGQTAVLHRTYSSFPFSVLDSVAYISRDGTVSSWIETEEFKKDAEWMRKAYQKGLINPDILTLQKEQFNNFLDSGNWVYKFGTSGLSDELKANQPGLTANDIVGLKLNPEKPDIRYIAVKNLNGVSSTSKHPAEAVKFIDWLYTNKENYNLFMYGIAGVDYRLDPQGLKERLTNPAGRALYGQADWMVGNVNYIITDTGTTPSQKEFLYTLDADAVNFPGSDFFFDPSPVDTEWANVKSEFAAAIAPIYLGVLPYNDAFPAALRRMKAAGIDRVITEYQRQLKAHMVSK